MASASVSAISSASASADPMRSVTRSTVAGSSGSRVVAVSASSRCQRTRAPISSTASSSKPIRVAIRAGDRLAGDAVLGEPALADVVQQRRHHQHVGTRHGADQRGRLDAGLDDVPVDGEPVDRRGVRQQPDPLPLGQEAVERPGLLERLPDGQQARPRGQQPDQQLSRLAGPGLGQRGALAGQARGGGRREHHVPLGGLGGRPQQQQRVRRRAGRRRRAPPPRRRRATPGATGSRSGRRAALTRRGPGQVRRPRVARSAGTGG